MRPCKNTHKNTIFSLLWYMGYFFKMVDIKKNVLFSGFNVEFYPAGYKKVFFETTLNICKVIDITSNWRCSDFCARCWFSIMFQLAGKSAF